MAHVLLYAAAVQAAMTGNEHSGPAGERMLERCTVDGTPAMTATALAFNASTLLAVERIDASDDAMARAVTLLDGVDGPAMELVTALVQCALVYQRRRLWELCEEVLDRERPRCCPSARTRCSSRWCCTTWSRSSSSGRARCASSARSTAARERGERGLAAARRLVEVPMPALWRDYGLSMGLLLGALTGTGRHWDAGSGARSCWRGSRPEASRTSPASWRLAVALPALDEGRHADAAREVAVALESFTGGNATSGRLLALRIAAEAEAAGRSDAAGAPRSTTASRSLACAGTTG